MSGPAGDERSRLLRALALSRRFHLFLAYVESPRAADQLVRALAGELPRLRKAEVELVRLDPHEGRASDAPLEDRELAERILIPLLSPPEERKAHGLVHVVDASRTTPADTDAWGRLFALWNEKRNALQQLGGEVLVVLPESLKRLFATSAPDVWSIRSGEYAIAEETSGHDASGTRGSLAAEKREALGWYRALPPLALFGGDLLVKPWMSGIVLAAGGEDIFLAPTFRGGPFPDDVALAQRELRSAEQVLGQGRFGEAGRLLRRILQDARAHLTFENRQRAEAALLVVLAAEDRADEALALLDGMTTPVGSSERLLQATAYTHWCAGRLGAASSTDTRRAGTPKRVEEEQSSVLRLVERGEIAKMKNCAAVLSFADDRYPFEAWNNRIICADRYFLTGDLQKATTLLGPSFPIGEGPDMHDEIASDIRARTLTALVELARGDRSRAVRRSRRPPPGDLRTKEPAMSARVSAFRAFASGLIEADEQQTEEAVGWLTEARAHIAEWSRTGLDRRSLHRASLAVDLAHATLDPTPTDPVGVARQLVKRAVALLGDTAEDFIARVLAVETRRELARRLADASDDGATAEAHRALDLARPLAGRGVPAWDAILAATEREAATRSMR
jgi:hypothetical protein